MKIQRIAQIRRRTDEAGGPASRRKAIGDALEEVNSDLVSLKRQREQCVNSFNIDVWRAGASKIYKHLDFPYYLRGDVEQGQLLRVVSYLIWLIALTAYASLMYRHHRSIFGVVVYCLLASLIAWGSTRFLNPKGLPDTAKLCRWVALVSLILTLLSVLALAHVFGLEARGSRGAVAAISSQASSRSLLWSERLTDNYHRLGYECALTEGLRRELEYESAHLAQR